MRIVQQPIMLLASTVLTFASATADDAFKPLFNGRDLAGWVRVNTAPSTWTVRDNMLICSGKPIGELRTTRMYQNFIMEVEWRHMRPRGNAGIFVWADDITARGVPFHRSIEVQVLENAYGNTQSHTTHGDIFPIHGATMTPINGRGGSRAFPSESRSLPSPQWNRYRITCRDGQVSLEVNGKLVTRGTECIPRRGYICLESEGGIVHYRNLRIQELPDTPIDSTHVAVADRGYRSIYLGLDLSGWKQSPDAGNSWRANDWRLVYDQASDATPTRLTTAEEWGDFGFLFDVRIPKDAAVSHVLLRGSEEARIALGPSVPDTKEHFVTAPDWNRFEGQLRDKKLTLTLNGQTILHDQPLANAPDRGPLIVVPGSSLQLANIYVRD